jgi:hypothetical protein
MTGFPIAPPVVPKLDLLDAKAGVVAANGSCTMVLATSSPSA